jgi:hypothetical protein
MASQTDRQPLQQNGRGSPSMLALMLPSAGRPQ